MADTPPLPKRWRFQFSLRTLMIVVITYGLLWLVTLKWGGSALAQHYAEVYKGDKPVINGDGSLTITHTRRPRQVTRNYTPPVIIECRGRVSCPAPFILLWKWETKDRLVKEFKRNEGDSDQYFWFAGYRKEWSKPRPPYLDFDFVGFMERCEKEDFRLHW